METLGLASALAHISATVEFNGSSADLILNAPLTTSLKLARPPPLGMVGPDWGACVARHASPVGENSVALLADLRQLLPLPHLFPSMRLQLLPVSQISDAVFVVGEAAESTPLFVVCRDGGWCFQVASADGERAGDFVCVTAKRASSGDVTARSRVILPPASAGLRCCGPVQPLLRSASKMAFASDAYIDAAQRRLVAWALWRASDGGTSNADCVSLSMAALAFPALGLLSAPGAKALLRGAFQRYPTLLAFREQDPLHGAQPTIAVIDPSRPVALQSLVLGSELTRLAACEQQVLDAAARLASNVPAAFAAARRLLLTVDAAPLASAAAGSGSAALLWRALLGLGAGRVGGLGVGGRSTTERLLRAHAVTLAVALDAGAVALDAELLNALRVVLRVQRGDANAAARVVRVALGRAVESSAGSGASGASSQLAVPAEDAQGEAEEDFDFGDLASALITRSVAPAELARQVLPPAQQLQPVPSRSASRSAVAMPSRTPTPISAGGGARVTRVLRQCKRTGTCTWVTLPSEVASVVAVAGGIDGVSDVLPPEATPCLWCSSRRHSATRCPTLLALMLGGTSAMVARLPAAWTADSAANQPASGRTSRAGDDGGGDQNGEMTFAELPQVQEERTEADAARAVMTVSGRRRSDKTALSDALNAALQQFSRRHILNGKMLELVGGKLTFNSVDDFRQTAANHRFSPAAVDEILALMTQPNSTGKRERDK